MTDKEARELAEEHWKWLESLLHKIYVDAMVHGFGHGVEQQGNKEKDISDANKVDLEK